MKKMIVLFVGCVLALSSCASGPKTTSDGRAGTSGVKPSWPKTTDDGRAVVGGMPLFVKNALKDIPADVLVGVGSARVGAAGLGNARTMATSRARAEIGRQLNLVGTSAILDFAASSEVSQKDAAAYGEEVSRQLSKADLTGSKVIEQDLDGDTPANYWVVVILGKDSVAKEINQAQAAARLAVPKAAAIDAAARMDKAFEKIASEPIGVSNN